MKSSLNWLNRYLDKPASREAMVEAMTHAGFPIEEWEAVAISTGEDWQLDVEVTSNRSDCLSHLGQAREFAAATGAQLVQPSFDLPEDASVKVHELTSVENTATDLCPVYTARVIQGVKVGPSPQWLVDCMEAVGLRSVNNVVDITNFVLLEMGQPLHAFDMNLLKENRIVVRKAKKGEAFVAIDGTKHELSDNMLVIADADKPVAVAGVMGGLDSEVNDQTTDILLESAVFEPLNVRRTSRTLKLSSDSSYRFERGVDPQGIERASQRAAALIVELAGGKLAQGVIRVGDDPASPKQIDLRVSRCQSLLGIELDAKQIAEYLNRLMLQPQVVEDGQLVRCTVPTYRLDLSREVDLIEEVARVHGLANIPVRERIEIVARPRQAVLKALDTLRDILTGQGFHEAMTFSFVGEKAGKAFLPRDHEPVMIGDDRRKAEPMLRPSVLPSLLTCRKLNQDAGNEHVRLFETASVWSGNGQGIEEHRELGMVLDAADAQSALHALQQTLLNLVGQLMGRKDVAIEPAEHDWLEPAAVVKVDGQPLATMGMIKPAIQKQFDLQTPVAAAIAPVEKLVANYPPKRTVQELPRFPGIERDLSILVDEATAWRDIAAQVEQAKPAMLECVDFLMTYRGKPIEKGRKSVSLRMLFRDASRTLRHDEVDPQMQEVITQLKKALNAELRA